METRQHATGRGPAGTRQPVTVRLFGGPTALIETGGLRLLTDPAFDAPGPATGGTRALAKSRHPAGAAEGIGTPHAVLLSHDRSVDIDNLGFAGRHLLATVVSGVPAPSRAPHPTEKHHA
ncbi:hypothetical protein ACWKT5_01210 [Streptomyces avermitilis]